MQAVSLRVQIADAQIALKTLKMELAEATAGVEQSTIQAAGGIKALPGAEAERKQALAHAVADSPICRKLGRDILAAEAKILRLEAMHGDEQDDAQRERWQVRGRLCDALEALGMAQPTSFFSGGEVERAAENVFDTMVSATAKGRMEAAAEAATAPGDARVLYNTGRHVVAVRGYSMITGDGVPDMEAAAEAAAEPRGPSPLAASMPAVDRYRAATAERSRTIADIQADELFGDD